MQRVHLIFITFLLYCDSDIDFTVVEQLAELTAKLRGPPGPPGRGKPGRPGPPGMQGPSGIDTYSRHNKTRPLCTLTYN